MKFPFSFPKIKKGKEQLALALDIGTETAKALIFKKKEKKSIILGASLEYYDRFGVFDSRDFEIDIIKKAISKGIEEAQKQAGLKANLALFELPANILKARVVSQLFKRESPKKIIDEKEEKIIFQTILKEAQKKISQIQAEHTGILPEEIQFLDLKILEIKIDGYRVPALRGYSGKNLDFRFLTSFLPKYYLKDIEDITQTFGFKNVSLIQEAQGLIFCLNEMPNGIFLDIGGEITQIFLAKNGLLEQISEFEMGGEAFSQALSERWGLSQLRTRILKERYSQKNLSEETKARIKEILWPEKQTWFRVLEDKLKKEVSITPLPSDIFIFGGGSLLPEIKEILTKGDWTGLSFPEQPKVKFIYPKDYYPPAALHIPPAHPKKELLNQVLNNPQYTPTLLICYAKKSF